MTRERETTTTSYSVQEGHSGRTMVARRSPDWRRLALPVLLAAILGILQVWGTRGRGYVAGWGDHFVLSPEGLSWAHPGAFANDWFMEVAPQPHWFFDVLTYVGESLGVLSFFYALFWAGGLLAFGAATSLLAHRFTPSSPWAVALGVTLLAAVTPWMIGGTGSPMITQALPAVLSANLIYLLTAGMLTERRILVLVLAPLIAVVHVQQGSIALVLLVSMLVVEGVRERKIDWFLVLTTGLTGGFVAFGLALRPVASNLEDFVRICDQIIPYHCSAHLWTRDDLLSTIGLIILAVLSVLMVPKRSRWIWYSTVGLAVLGYAGGLMVDALRIPFLGTLAQGVNVYRLGAVLLPFAIWGAFAPMLVRLRGWRVAALLVAWGAGWGGFLMATGWQTELRPRVILLGLALLVPICWYMIRARSGREPQAPSGSAALAAGLIVLVVTGATGGLAVRAPNFTFIGDDSARQWGAEVREAVPEGEVLVASPRFEWVKLMTQRAVIVDCKDVPYGGDAWDEWLRRLDALGGFRQCVEPRVLYDELSAAQLVDIADEFGSDFIVVNPNAPETVEDLEDLGWIHVVRPVGPAGADVLQRG